MSFTTIAQNGSGVSPQKDLTSINKDIEQQLGNRLNVFEFKLSEQGYDIVTKKTYRLH